MADDKTTAKQALARFVDDDTKLRRLMDKQMREGCSMATPLGDLCGADCECAKAAGIDATDWLKDRS